jgi:hypothetical protein
VIDPEKGAVAIRLARVGYRYGWHSDKDGPDTLLKLADLLDQVNMLLYHQPNANRLSTALAHDTKYGGRPVSVHDFQRLVWRVQEAARGPAHRGRGKPPDEEKLNLKAAYRVLSDFWMMEQGTHSFTNVWNAPPNSAKEPVDPFAARNAQDAKGKDAAGKHAAGKHAKGHLVPTSPAACFLFDAMKEVDPDRPRLAQELRELMVVTGRDIKQGNYDYLADVVDDGPQRDTTPSLPRIPVKRKRDDGV